MSYLLSLPILPTWANGVIFPLMLSFLCFVYMSCSSCCNSLIFLTWAYPLITFLLLKGYKGVFIQVLRYSQVLVILANYILSLLPPSKPLNISYLLYRLCIVSPLSPSFFPFLCFIIMKKSLFYLLFYKIICCKTYP